tara:strand:- start:172 stop:483 length:312 start_codon:yes stop_codon:yes gene_type:complete
MRNKNWIEFNNNHEMKNKDISAQNCFIKSKKLRINTEKKGKKGKIITVISGFISEDSYQLEKLLKKIKVYCGTGGTLNEKNIQLQGDMRNKVIDFLRKDGYEI